MLNLLHMKSAMPKSKYVGLRELRENMNAYIEAVKKGKSFVVLRKSKPVFKITPVDEWGDEGEWEIIADFREIDPKGVPAEELLKVLKELENES